MGNAVIGMGSNIGDRFGYLKSAAKAIALLPGTEILKISKVYETEPVGYLDQPSFYNAVMLVETSLSPKTLLGACLGIEAMCGRIRTVKDGPRELDLDLLLYENVKSESYELMLPHPKILQRAFVLVPLNDIYPSGRAQGLYFTPSYREIDKSGVVETLLKIEI